MSDVVLIDREEAARLLDEAAMIASPDGMIPVGDLEYERLKRLVETLEKAADAIRQLPPYATTPRDGAATDDVGHPRINGWPCVCPECVAKRSSRNNDLQELVRLACEDPANRTGHTQLQMCRFLDRLREQVMTFPDARAARVDEWRDIETMPFGQQVLLLWLGGDPAPHYEITMGYIHPNDEWKRDTYWSPCGEYRSMEKIVGWAPITPAAPNALAEKEK